MRENDFVKLCQTILITRSYETFRRYGVRNSLDCWLHPHSAGCELDWEARWETLWKNYRRLLSAASRECLLYCHFWCRSSWS